jgi:hypothetical protein
MSIPKGTEKWRETENLTFQEMALGERLQAFLLNEIQQLQ